MHEKSFFESYSIEDFNKLRCSDYRWKSLDRLRAQGDLWKTISSYLTYNTEQRILQNKMCNVFNEYISEYLR